MSLIKNLPRIAESWFEFIKASDYTKQLMEARLRICDLCPEKQQLNSSGKFLVGLLNDEASIYKCAQCSCPLAAKTAHPGNECPLGKWKKAGA